MSTIFKLTNKVALITGACGGIGRAISHKLHSQGATIIITGRSKDALEKLKEDLGGDRIFTLVSDLSNQNEADKLIEKSEEYTQRKIDILVCNAGVTQDMLAMRMKDEQWENVLNLNLETPFRISRAALKSMLRQRSGRIIFISSIVALTGNIGQVNYAASKAGLIGMMKTLALESASRNVTVNAIAPGFIQTAMTENIPEKNKEQLLKNIPLGRMGTPDDIANGVLFLASEEASWITGNTLHINGGMYMG